MHKISMRNQELSYCLNPIALRKAERPKLYAMLAFLRALGLKHCSVAHSNGIWEQIYMGPQIQFSIRSPRSLIRSPKKKIKEDNQYSR